MPGISTYSDDYYIYSVDLMFAYINLKNPDYESKKVKELSKMLGLKCWGSVDASYRYSPLDVLENPKKYKKDYERIQDADLKYPIIMTSTEEIIDGMHRLTKAVMNKKKYIKAFIFSKKLLKKFIIGKINQWNKVDKMNIHEFIEAFYKQFKKLQ